VADTLFVTPLLAVVTLDVLWNMDAAARATPLLQVIITALRAHQVPAEAGAAAAAAAAAARRRRRGGRFRGRPGGARDGAALRHTSLWMLLEPARWLAAQLHAALEEQAERRAGGGGGGQQPQLQQQPGGGGIMGAEAEVVVRRVAQAARQQGLLGLG
ncbi:hypothetical protein Agub_g5878, partial [Astrephomene gubernaculifera]